MKTKKKARCKKGKLKLFMGSYLWIVGGYIFIVVLWFVFMYYKDK